MHIDFNIVFFNIISVFLFWFCVFVQESEGVSTLVKERNMKQITWVDELPQVS